ncbi:glycosyltransferase family 1 protein [Geitlerinema splendidum]|nr:glycosyltransferase family 1 protein [Geitlerinema splendidum]
MFSNQNKGKIALISVHGDPAVEIGKEEAGGQNVYVRCCGEALAKQGWQVDLFTRKASPDQENIVVHSPNCRTIRLNAGPEAFIGRDDLFGYLPEFVESFKQFQEREGTLYPIIHTNYWLSSWVGMQLRKSQLLKLVHTYHSLGAIKYKSISTIPLVAKTRLEVEKACLETADCIVATSPQEEEHMRTYVSEKGNIKVIPCGTNIERFGSVRREAARDKLQLSPDDRVVLYVGRFDPRKGIETAVRAVSHLSSERKAQLKLMIAGGWTPGEKDGEERDRIGQLTQALGIENNVQFVGRLDHTVLPTYYAAADVCVVPSHYEPFGLVAIEAMACGTPVIASNVGGLKFTVIPEETGLLAPPKDDRAFAEAIDRILADPQWRSQLGEQARSRVEAKFSWDGVASQLGELYSDSIQQLTTEFFKHHFAG